MKIGTQFKVKKIIKKKYFKILLMEQEIEKFKSEVIKINQRIKEFL